MFALSEIESEKIEQFKKIIINYWKHSNQN